MCNTEFAPGSHVGRAYAVCVKVNLLGPSTERISLVHSVSPQTFQVSWRQGADIMFSADALLLPRAVLRHGALEKAAQARCFPPLGEGGSGAAPPPGVEQRYGARVSLQQRASANFPFLSAQSDGVPSPCHGVRRPHKTASHEP